MTCRTGEHLGNGCVGFHGTECQVTKTRYISPTSSNSYAGIISYRDYVLIQVSTCSWPDALSTSVPVSINSYNINTKMVGR